MLFSASQGALWWKLFKLSLTCIVPTFNACKLNVPRFDALLRPNLFTRLFHTFELQHQQTILLCFCSLILFKFYDLLYQLLTFISLPLIPLSQTSQLTSDIDVFIWLQLSFKIGNPLLLSRYSCLFTAYFLTLVHLLLSGESDVLHKLSYLRRIVICVLQLD